MTSQNKKYRSKNIEWKPYLREAFYLAASFCAAIGFSCSTVPTCRDRTLVRPYPYSAIQPQGHKDAKGSQGLPRVTCVFVANLTSGLYFSFILSNLKEIFQHEKNNSRVSTCMFVDLYICIFSTREKTRGANSPVLVCDAHSR